MYITEGKRVRIRRLKVEDVFEMKRWGKHNNPLFQDYNFPDLNDDEVREWFKIKTTQRNNVCFSVTNEGNVIIGYINVKEIKRFRRNAKLGIVFDPNYVDKGYGTESILLLLKYFFNDMNMKCMYLDVAKHNKRAIRCYEKCGFKTVNEYKDKLYDQNINIFDDEQFADIRDSFVISNSIIYGYYYRMKVERANNSQILSTDS